MTDHDALLLALGSPPTLCVHGPLVVCQGHGEVPDETPLRWKIAQGFGVRPTMATGQHSGEEARSIVAQADDEVTVLTHGYHVPRMFLTLVKALLDAEREYQLRVYMLGIPGNSHKWVEEQRKIAQYQDRGYCASYAQALSYLRWRDA